MVVADREGEDFRSTFFSRFTTALTAIVMLWAFCRSPSSSDAVLGLTSRVRKGKYICPSERAHGDSRDVVVFTYPGPGSV